MPVHPTDEMLSALLDDEDDDGALAHVGDCAACRDRLAQLAAAADAVGTAPPAPPGARESAVQAALREAGLAQPVTTAIPRAPGAPGARPLGPRPLGARPPGRRRDSTRRRPERRTLATLGWVGLAAAFIALFAVPALLGRTASSKKATSAASATTVAPAPRGPEAATGAAGPTAPASTAVTPAEAAAPMLGVAGLPADLGAQSDSTALTQQLRQLLSGGPGGFAATSAVPAERQAGYGSSAPLTCRSAAAASTGAGSAASLAYAARLTWRGTPAEVFVFSVAPSGSAQPASSAPRTASAGSPGSPARVAGIMGVGSCQLLQTLSV
jgi:hypothetical protein